MLLFCLLHYWTDYKQINFEFHYTVQWKLWLETGFPGMLYVEQCSLNLLLTKSSNCVLFSRNHSLRPDKDAGIRRVNNLFNYNGFLYLEYLSVNWNWTHSARSFKYFLIVIYFKNFYKYFMLPTETIRYFKI